MSLLSGCHVSHLENVDTDELDRLLRLVVDVENLFMCVHKEEDSDTKQVYFFLFKVNIQHGHIHSVVDSWFMLSITCSLGPPPPPLLLVSLSVHDTTVWIVHSVVAIILSTNHVSFKSSMTNRSQILKVLLLLVLLNISALMTTTYP